MTFFFNIDHQKTGLLEKSLTDIHMKMQQYELNILYF